MHQKNEEKERDDFAEAEIEPDAEKIDLARKEGGGGGWKEEAPDKN